MTNEIPMFDLTPHASRTLPGTWLAEIIECK
jgi:hypothetical protein